MSQIELASKIVGEYGFEKKYSYTDGWESNQSTTKTASVEVNQEVDPRTKIKVVMVMTLNKIKVPYTAKYRGDGVDVAQEMERN